MYVYNWFYGCLSILLSLVNLKQLKNYMVYGKGKI
jgi:hypothetical protein